jgi:hypothetical protein
MKLKHWAIVVLLLILFTGALFAQSTLGVLKGVVTDESGAVIPGAKITITGGTYTRTITSGADGSYTLAGIPTGTYSLQTTFSGMAPYQNTAVVVNAGGMTTLNIQLRVQLENQQVTVQETVQNAVSTDPSNNVGALVLKGEDLEALSDDPDDLQDDLTALAGPSAGPNGAQMFIDGFTGGRLPPKESIREIRINQNPFSAEYDKLGYGRIEIFTKPGTDKFHGQAFMNFSDGIWDARNPFSNNKAPFQYKNYGGNLSGPISKKSSFFVDFERRDVDENAVVNAQTLDPVTLTPVTVAQSVVTPQTRMTISPRVDYQLTPNNTLMARYTYTETDFPNAFRGGFALPQTASSSAMTEHTVQLTETAVLGAKAVNETRFQYIDENTNQRGFNSTDPQINVLQSFIGGGSTIGLNHVGTRNYELQNYTSITHGTHLFRFGARIRAVQDDEFAQTNFNGTFTFGSAFNVPELDANNLPTGNVLPSIDSLESYRRTLLFQRMNYTPAEIRALGGMPTQFSISGGNPYAAVNQIDYGLFIQDDWRLKSNLTLSLGLRYETQTNIHDWTDFAPRIGFAWSPDAKGNRPGKTVIRGGSGIFYDRFSQTYTLDAIRYNGINQQQFVLPGDQVNFFPFVPNTDTLTQLRPQATDVVYSGLRAPYIIQSAIGVERQLPFNTTVAVTFTNSHGLHELVSRNINAPMPGTGALPYPDLGQLQLFESSGIFNQNQLMFNVNTRMTSKLSFFAMYANNHAKSNTDGANYFPENQYNLDAEYGRSSMDIRHRFALGGSLLMKWGFRLSPFIIAHSGAPFNIFVGRDLNGDLIINDRPAFATAAQLGQPNIMQTAWGIFNLAPKPGDQIIPRNYGDGPGYFAVNLRLSKTWGFGPERGSNVRPSGGDGFGGGRGDHGGRGGGGGGMRGGGMRMGGGGGGRGGFFGGDTTSRRYNLIASINARNLFNSTNYGPYTGNLGSPYFGTSNSLSGGGFGGPGGGGGFAGAATNRRIDLSLRFVF